MNTIILIITINTVLILIAIFVVCNLIEYKIKNLKNELTRQEIVDYINSMPVYIRDEQCNILKHHAHISSFNSDDYSSVKYRKILFYMFFEVHRTH